MAAYKVDVIMEVLTTIAQVFIVIFIGLFVEQKGKISVAAGDAGVPCGCPKKLGQG